LITATVQIPPIIDSYQAQALIFCTFYLHYQVANDLERRIFGARRRDSGKNTVPPLFGADFPAFSFCKHSVSYFIIYVYGIHSHHLAFLPQLAHNWYAACQIGIDC
jgi:hypothetical protein